ncbi:MAG: amidohydrolase family protein [Bacillota bacterium]
MLAIINAKVATPAGDFSRHVVLVENGKILEVGDIRVPAGAAVLDSHDGYLVPGLVDIHTQVGLREEGLGAEGMDHNEATAAATPQLRAIDGINPEDLAFADALAAGVTTVACAPGSGNVLGGQGVVLRTAGQAIDDMIIGPWGMKAALGEEPKSGRPGQSPATRMATAAVLREQLAKAREYENKRGDEKPPDRHLGYEALLPVLNREVPLWVQANRADDILTALRLAREFQVRLVILQAAEAHRVADRLREAGAACVLGPLSGFRYRVEQRGLDPAAPARLLEAGVPVALSTGHPATGIGALPVMAGLAIRFGLSEAEALKCVTLYPAQMASLQHRVGSIAPGLDANLVLLRGRPFYLHSTPNMVMIEGKIAYGQCQADPPLA